MLLLLPFICQPIGNEPDPAIGRPTLAFVAAQGVTDLKKILERRLASVEAQQHGVFHVDVTADVAPLFPAGQSFEETRRTVERQGLGEPRRFKGEPHDGTTMFVSRSSLEPDASDDVYVVIDFDFTGRTEADMRLSGVKAFLRAANM